MPFTSNCPELLDLIIVPSGIVHTILSLIVTVPIKDMITLEDVSVQVIFSITIPSTPKALIPFPLAVLFGYDFIGTSKRYAA